MSNNLVNAAAGVGVATETIQLVWSHVVGVPLLLLGAGLLLWPNARKAQATGRIVAVEGTCPAAADNKSLPPCRVRIAFTAPEDSVERTFLESDQSALAPSVGDTVTVYYDPRDPAGTATRSNPVGTRVLGAIICVLVSLYLGYRWLKFYLVRRYKPLAALEGTRDVLNVPMQLFNPGPRFSGGGVTITPR